MPLPKDHDRLVFQAHDGYRKSLKSGNTSRRRCALPTCKPGATPLNELKTCAQCRNVWYCCADHQRKDWKRHKSMCAVKKHSHSVGETVSASLVARGFPESHILVAMLQDFVALHQRMLSRVVGQYLASRCSESGKPYDQAIDYRTEYIMFEVCYREGNDISPASRFKIMDGYLQSASDMPPDQRKNFDKYINNVLEGNLKTSMQTFPDLATLCCALFFVRDVSFMYQTSVELHSEHFHYKPDPGDKDWWSSLDRNARDGVVIRRIYSKEAKNYYSEYVGILLQHGEDEWKWGMDEEDPDNLDRKRDLQRAIEAAQKANASA